MTESATSDEEAVRRTRLAATIERGDIVIGVVLAAIFAAAFVTAWQWEAIAAYFPLTATCLGLVLCSIFVARCIVMMRRRDVAEPLHSVKDASNTEEATLDQADSDHAFFASVSLSVWLVSLTFFVAFFAALYVVGLYPTSILFTVIYLRFQARSSWLFSVLYAAVMTGGLYALFEMALKLPVPAGLVGLS